MFFNGRFRMKKQAALHTKIAGILDAKIKIL